MPLTTVSPTTQQPAVKAAYEAMHEQISIANLQGIGMREQQQDAFGVSVLGAYTDRGLLAVLCDGMGGMVDGAQIAQYAVDAIMRDFPYGEPEKLSEVNELLNNINAAIARRYCGRGGTTLVLAYLFASKLWFWCIGDSDLFLLRDDTLYAVNCRHEYLNDKILLALAGNIPLSAAYGDMQHGALTEYLGNEDINADYSHVPFTLKPNDKLLLCSDGLSDTLNLSMIERAMRLSPPDAAQALESSITAANMPMQDNYTAIVIGINN
ncbi:Protein phosphatase PrpC [bioreactor metagenome]|uniref:Protein phosphatase PrpC n=1 Tax=bioreactor metagenome TaxID=1076179 RepID=A0A645CM99_9ZZZZ